MDALPIPLILRVPSAKVMMETSSRFGDRTGDRLREVKQPGGRARSSFIPSPSLMPLQSIALVKLLHH